jgi:hypothetical protein
MGVVFHYFCRKLILNMIGTVIREGDWFNNAKLKKNMC